MYRYIALMWSRADREAERAAKFLAAKLPEVSAHAWSLSWDCAGLAIYHAGEHKGRMQTYRLQGERGAVLGRLFRNDYSSVVDDLDEFESRKCLETKGQHLIDNYWGRYVLFLRDNDRNLSLVMRDPCGDFPCHFIESNRLRIFFSDMEDCAKFEMQDFSVNWNVVRSNLVLRLAQKRETGLNEVKEILPGQRIEVRPNRTTGKFVWDPYAIAEREHISDSNRAANSLRRTVVNTIQAWAQCHDRVTISIGGLDSSIVLACLASTPKKPDIICETNFTESPRGDERFYSRQAASWARVPINEWKLDHGNVSLGSLFTRNRTAKLPISTDCVKLARSQLNTARKIKADAIFLGTGGDNIFFQMPRAYGAIDYVYRFGFGPHFVSVLLEASRYGNCSVFNVFSRILRDRYSNTNLDFRRIQNELNLNERSSILSPELSEFSQLESLIHPLLIPKSDMPIGKALQIFTSVFLPFPYYDDLDPTYSFESARPLLSQPILELCLQLPTWILTYGGVDRGLARRAFSSYLPSDIIRRQSKSTPSEHYDNVFAHNIDFLRSILLGGELVREKLLIRDELERALRKEGQKASHDARSLILYCAGIEAWLQKWNVRNTQRAKISA